MCKIVPKILTFAVMEKTIKPIARFHSPLTSKFGVPRQSGIVECLRGRVVMEGEYKDPEVLRGLEDFDVIWLIWGFSMNPESHNKTARPPLLGGNTQMGVFATRAPFRPNGMGLSAVRIESIELSSPEGPCINVLGADLTHGTPIYDIKPYLPYADCYPQARGGFTDANQWRTLDVDIPQHIASKVDDEDKTVIERLLSLDPRPHYHDSPERIYGMEYNGMDIRFVVDDRQLIVKDIVKRQR